MYAEGDPRTDLESALERAISEDRLISVQTISSNFPSAYDEARLSYAESYSLVQFLLDQYDGDRMLDLLSIFKDGSSYDDALQQAYGFDSAGLDDLWRMSLGLEPGEPSPISSPRRVSSAARRHRREPVIVVLWVSPYWACSSSRA